MKKLKAEKVSRDRAGFVRHCFALARGLGSNVGHYIFQWVAIAGVVACVATLFGLMGRFNWLLDLFSHFRLQYIAVLLVADLAFLLRRRWRTAGIFSVFIFVNLGVVLPLYFGGTASSPENTQSLRAMLSNVNTHGGDPLKLEQLIREVDPDILVLEEVSSKWIVALASLTNAYPHSYICAQGDNFGIALYSRFPIQSKEIVYMSEAMVPSIIAVIDVGRGGFRVIATHPLPPAGSGYSRMRNEQLEKLADCVDSSMPLIILGDLNTTPWNYYFRRLLRHSGLHDSTQGYGVQPTWPSCFWPLLIPLDHCLHSSDVFIENRQTGANIGSDHYPLIIDFSIL